jgi:site-specific recombinase XerD
VSDPTLGQLLHTYFVDHLVALKGLRSGTIRSYRDTVRLFLVFVARDRGRAITRLHLEDLTFERTLAFLRHLEEVRGNHPRTRNQRLAALRSLFGFLAERAPEFLHVCQRVAAIPTKRAAPAEIRFLDRAEITKMLVAIPKQGRHALRDRALLVFLYNTGARVQEVADLRSGQLDLGEHARVRLCGKGGKWRACPLWDETARLLRALGENAAPDSAAPVFTARKGRPLTRFGIYKIVRRRARVLDETPSARRGQRVSPHILRHSMAVHLLESGVEVNAIRGWLGHVQLETTYRYAEITMRAKEEALRACEIVDGASTGSPAPAAWRSDQALLSWLSSL